jgi:hypothetical protein
MSDRASVNHASIELLTDFFGKMLFEVNCHLHPLDSISSACKTVLSSLEKLNKDLLTPKDPLFGSGCGAEKIILGMNSMRYKDSCGEPMTFKLFLENEGLGAGFVIRYRGNRLHVLFHLASIYVQHYDAFVHYLNHKCTVSNSLRAALIEALSTPYYYC